MSSLIFGRDFSRAFNDAFAQSSAAAQERDMQQRREAARLKELSAGVDNELAQASYSAGLAPVMKGGALDRAATGAATLAAQNEQRLKMANVMAAIEAEKRKQSTADAQADALVRGGITPSGDPVADFNRLREQDMAHQVKMDQVRSAIAAQQKAIEQGYGSLVGAGGAPTPEFFEQVRKARDAHDLEKVHATVRARAEAEAEAGERTRNLRDVRDYKVYVGKEPANGEYLTPEEYAALNVTSVNTPTSFDALGRPTSFMRTKVAGGAALPGTIKPPAMPAPAPLPSAIGQQNPKDAQALQWARANPADPRAKAILQKLGLAK